VKFNRLVRNSPRQRYAHIVGWGKYAPEKVLTNDDLSRMMDTSDEWIKSRTGVSERRIVSEKESTATIAIRAAQDALEVADFDAANLDLIIVATATPDYFFPSTACIVQDALGATHAAAFDLAAGCTGFIYGLAMASNSIRCGAYKSTLVIGAEALSRIVDWEDRNTCVLFGDGAGAALLVGSEVEGGVLSTVLGADGSGGELLIVPAGGSRLPASQETVLNRLHYIKMNGREVFRFATRVMEQASREVCNEVGLTLDDIDLFIPHQANDRIIQAAAKALKVPSERFFVNLEHYGNTSAASIPVALCEAIEKGNVKPGDNILMVGFGAGLTWGATVVRWGVPLPVEAPYWWRRLWHLVYYRWAGLRSIVLRVWRQLEALLFDHNGDGQKPKPADKEQERKGQEQRLDTGKQPEEPPGPSGPGQAPTASEAEAPSQGKGQI
jgi:3-oxoacyl-[acyl-carrier-protein] synthase-3